MIVLAWSAAAIAGMAALLTAFNLLVWPRGRDAERPATALRFSVLIPARNEEASIERAVRSVFRSRPNIHEVIVYDDGSTDATPDILARLQEEYPALRVERGVPLPEGWIGKPHACHQLGQRATGDVLFFVDADVELESHGVARVEDLLERYRAELVTAVPRQLMGTGFERLVMPLLHLTYTSWLPMPLVWLTHDPRFLAANGQILALRRPTYDAIGGFEAVRQEVVDDMAICRLVKASQKRVVFADGFHIARCRMYESAKGVWEGFSKNLYEGIGESIFALAVVMALYTFAFVVPYVLGVAALAGADRLVMPALAGIGANLLLRLLLAVRFHQPGWGIVAHPFAVLVFLGIAFNSFLWSTRDAITWSGRTYAARRRRTELT